MKLKIFTQRKWNYTALAFLLPVVGLLVLRLIETLTYSGEFSMLYSDCYHQYYPFFLEFRRTLLSGESLLYSWNVGMGMDYLGLLSYYLASPLNLLSVLVPESLTLTYFSMLMPLKLGLASMFFAIFLKKTFRKDDLSISLFGCFYGLCAWALAYQWNVMWLDTFALLPLVMLGMLSLLEQKKFILYTVTLFLSIYSNYYIGFFTCIFVFLSFFCYQICRWQGAKKFFLDMLRIALFSALAIGMTAIVSLPALAALQSTQSGINEFPAGITFNTKEQNLKSLFKAMRVVAGNMSGALKPTFLEGAPNLYCGIGTNILMFLFLTCRQVKLRDKLCTAFLLLFFNLSFVIRQLDYIWHGFHFTNMLPFRFSFLHSFVMLYVAYRAWLLRKQFRPWQLLTAGALALVLMLFSRGLEDFTDLITGQTALLPWSGMSNIFENAKDVIRACIFPVYNLVFLVGYPLGMLFMQRRKPVPAEADREQQRAWLQAGLRQRRIGSSVLLGIMGLELVLNLANFGLHFSGANVADYPRGKQDTAAVIAYMDQLEAETLFYRAETAHSQTLNDGALNGYNGISTFTSSANVKVTEFMTALGYGAKSTNNRYCFEESSPVANLFLGLKYMIERDGSVKENAYFDDVYSSGDVHLLENNAYLPLGFLANSQLCDVDFTSADDPFRFQNELMRAASGVAQDVWYPLDSSAITISGTDLTLNTQPETGSCSYVPSETADGVITYRCVADREGLLCFYLEPSVKVKFSVYVNGAEEPLYNDDSNIPQMLSVCNVVPGDEVRIDITGDEKEEGTIRVRAAILDEAVFRQGYQVLAASTLELTRFERTCVEGTVSCDRDGVLYTSIPQNGNWTATVDGEPAQTVLIGDAMIGLRLSEGQHTVRFVYHNAAFSLGWKISLACLAGFIGISLLVYRPGFPRRKGKYEH